MIQTGSVPAGSPSREAPGHPPRPSGAVGVPRYRRISPWYLLPMILSAFIAIWGGWVGLGQMTGFGVVQLLPGIWDSLKINTSITLPLGMEAYAAYALKAFVTRGINPKAKEFAKVSAAGAMVVGLLGQIGYHLMAAAHVSAAPWMVTTLVSCVPVAVLGMAATLWHLLDDEEMVVELAPAAPVAEPVLAGPTWATKSAPIAYAAPPLFPVVQPAAPPAATVEPPESILEQTAPMPRLVRTEQDRRSAAAPVTAAPARRSKEETRRLIEQHQAKNPAATQAEIGAALGISDRYVRTVLRSA